MTEPEATGERSAPGDPSARGEASARTIRLRRLLPMLALLVGGALSAVVAVAVARWEDGLARREFTAVSENHLLVLQSGWNEYLSKLTALQALFLASDHVGRDEFEAFTARLLQDQPAIQNFSWAPLVNRAQRTAHEQQGRDEGLPDYAIKAVPRHGTLVASLNQHEYLPLFYGTLPRTTRTYGLDLLAQPATRSRAERARDSGDLVSVPNWMMHSTGERGILFSLPVYRRGSATGTLEERRANFIGLVHGAFRMKGMVEHSIGANTRPRGIDVHVFAADAAPNDAPLVVHWSRMRTPAEPETPRTLAALTDAEHWTGEIRTANERWIVITTPLESGPLMARHDRAWIMLGAGLLLTLLVTAYIVAVQRHTRRLLVANRKVAELAQTDALTGLANRRHFLERLETAFAAYREDGPAFAVIYFDLDHFKDVNDTRGHPVGDRLLREVAARVRSVVADADLVARFGGDEFAVLQAEATGVESALRLAARITQALDAPFPLADGEVHVNASIGVARCSAQVADAKTIMIQADLALYRAKEDGRNCVRLHSPDLDRRFHERVSVAEEIRAGLGRGEFELHYQPQVELRSGRIIGMEALLRWNHPTRGLLRPDSFIGVAESTGLILPLGRFAFDEACRQLRLWLDGGAAPATVAVNVSAVQIKHAPDLQRDIAQSLARWQIPRGAMEIELTEAMLMEVTEKHGRMLQHLHALGLKVAIADFGAGCSSLNGLTMSPINRLKMARELVSRSATEPRCATVVRATIRLAAELGIEVLAEGVEDAPQVAFLSRAGCRDVQGFHFSRPVDARAATALLQAGMIGPAHAPRLRERAG